MKRTVAQIALTLLVAFAFCPAWAEPPEASGPRVVRYEGSWFLGSGDPDRMLFASFGISLEGVSMWCRGERPPAESMFLFDAQDVISPADEGTILETFQAKRVPTLVWEALEPWDWSTDWDRFWDLFCAAVLSGDPIAQGSTQMSWTDSDMYALYYEHDRVETWGLNARGRIQGTDGGQFFFRHSGRCVWHEAPDPATLKCNTTILLH